MPESTGRFERLRTLRRRSNEVWQAGFIAAPGPLVGHDELRHMWTLAIVSGPRTRKAMSPGATPDDLEAVLGAFEHFADDGEGGGALPGRIQVRDPDLAACLGDLCTGLGIPLERPRELALLDALHDEIAEAAPWVRQPALSDVAGVDPELLWAFAEAAATYRRTRPWWRLGPEDLIRVASPPSGFPWVIVHPEALTLFVHAGDMEARIAGDLRRPSCELIFGDEEEIAARDHDAFRELGLPLVDHSSWPLVTVLQPGGLPRAPDRELLDWMVGVLHALAQTREEAIESGAWTVEAPTRAGSVHYELELPALLEVIDDLAQEELPAAAEERALQLLEQAHLAVGRPRIHLARQALEAAPGHPEAQLILAEECQDPELRIEGYTTALEWSERHESLGRSPARPGPSSAPTLPASLRARHGLALALEAAGQGAAALTHLEALADLDPDNHLELFETTFILLLSMGHDEEARQLLARNRGRPSSVFYYGAVLVALRLEKAGPLAEVLLRKAVAFNPFVPRLLLPEHDEGIAPYELAELQQDAYDTVQTKYEVYGIPYLESPAQRNLPHLMDAATDALACAEDLGPAWRDTPGALDWLASQALDAGR